MNENIKVIREAKALVKNASVQHCNAYNELCSGIFGEVVMSVLDGEMRMAKNLSMLENYFLSDEQKIYANESEIQMLKEQES